MNSKKTSLYFLISILISLLGNAISEYALMWYSIEKIGSNLTSFNDHSISFFYIGQAIGALTIAPFLSVLFDRLSKKLGSIIIDLLYAIVLLVSYYLYKYASIDYISIFVISSFLRALSIVHIGGVALSALKKLSNKLEIESIVSNYVIAVTVANGLGYALSGLFFNSFGFEACMFLGVITFIPAIVSYLLIFTSSDKGITQERNFIQEYKEGFSFLFKDKYLLGAALSISIFNIAGGLIPALMGIAFKVHMPDSSNLFSIILGLGLIIGISFLGYFKNLSKRLDISFIIPLTVLPCIVIMGVTIFNSHPYIFALLYFFACAGSTMRNFCTSQLRVSRIPKHLMGRVNTSYNVVLTMGQIVGGIVVLPLFQKEMSQGSSFSVLMFLLASIASIIILPRVNFSKTLEDSN